MSSDEVLRISGLEVAVPGAMAVRGIDLSIARGETLALVGESGCGKSLTASSIMQLLPPGVRIAGGSIEVAGTDLARATPRLVRAMRGKVMSLILQEPMTSLDPVLSVGGQIVEVLRRHEPLSRRGARERAIELMDLVGIRSPAQRFGDYPHQFSGGMRQRIMIAIAIACSPQLLIADEPTTALDVTTQAQIMDLISRLKERLSMGVLLITHDFAAVSRWADRIAVMYAGRVVEQATAQQFLRRPRHPYSRGLLGARIGAGDHYTTRRLTEVRGSVASALRQPGCAFAPRCPLAIDECSRSVPALAAVDAGWSAACMRLEEVA